MMSVLVPRDLDEALGMLSEHPEADILAGGTDFMVEVNYRHRSPESVVGIGGVKEIAGWRIEGETDSGTGEDSSGGAGSATDHIWIGANMTYSDMAEASFARLLPALSQAARTVGSPQIRNAGTIGGNLGTASPAGDTLPVLAALDAQILLRSASGSRELSLGEFITGVKQTALLPGELIEGVRVANVASGVGRTQANGASQGNGEFLKVGTRNAMVISVASVALIARHELRKVCVGLGSVSAVPMRATEAEDFISSRIDWEADWEADPDAGHSASAVLDPADAEVFGEMVAEAATPIDDHRSTATYRSHAVGVMAKRALLRIFGG